MKTTVEALRRVLDILAPVMPKKSTLPITNNVLLQEGKALATDLTVAVELQMPEALEPILLPHRLVSEALKFIAGSSPLEITTEERDGGLFAVLRTGQASLRYHVEKPEEFPPISHADGSMGTWEVDGAALLAGMEAVRPYSAKEDSRPVLTCVCLTLGEPAEVVGADGFRLGIKRLPFNMAVSDSTAKRVLVPGSAVRVLAHVWELSDKPRRPNPGATLAIALLAKLTLRMDVSDKLVTFDMGEAKVSVHWEPGTFPNYAHLVPQLYLWKLTVNAEELYRAVESVGAIANSGSGIVRFIWGPEGPLTVKAMAVETGEMEVNVHAQVQGEVGAIAFSFNYLSTTLKGLDALVTIEGTTPSSPGVFRHYLSPLVVIMPMFVQPETKPDETQDASVQPTENTEESPEVAEEPVDQVGGSEEPKEQGAVMEAQASAPEKARPRRRGNRR